MKSLRSRVIFIFALVMLALYYISPTLIYFSLPKADRNDEKVLEAAIPSWLPKKHIKLGLDLQGGVQLVLGVDIDGAVDNKMARLATEVSRWSKDNNKSVSEAFNVKSKQVLRVETADGVDLGALKVDIFQEYSGLEEVTRGSNSIDFRYSEPELKRIRLAALEQAERVVRNRVDKWGVSEPSITRRVDGSILVQLPGFKDPQRARELLGRTAQLQFKMLDENFKGFDAFSNSLPEGVTIQRRGNKGVASLAGENKQAIIDFAKGKVPEGRVLLFEETRTGNKTFYTGMVVKAGSELSGEDILDAQVSYDQSSLDYRPVVSLKFTAMGSKRFADVTGDNIGTRMAIVLDQIIVSDPVIQAKISGGSAQITLGTSQDRSVVEKDARELALILRSGALPAPIEILEERQVGATLGPELANQGVSSVVLGLVLVLIFMIAYYKQSGVISSVALVFNAIFLLALMASFGFALTLPGFAGFVLTLGMAVDANVLINERIRQELREGRDAMVSVVNGFQKVTWTIIDANVTTLIAAFVLIETNSSGPIKGFAVALILGLLASMFTSLYVSKAFFQASIDRISSEDKRKKFLGFKAATSQRVFKIDFLRYSKFMVSLLVAIIIAVVGVGATKGVNWSVDFAGGTEMEILFAKPVQSSEIRAALKTTGVADASLQAIGSKADHYLVRFEKVDGGKQMVHDIQGGLLEKLKAFTPDIQRVDFVGPRVGKELRRQGAMSVIWAMIGILVYIALRFDMRFGPGAIVKMIGDVFVIIGFYVFFQRSFDLTSIAALLTVVGYSVNDTIVIYDRIRENMATHSKWKLYDTINNSLNETLSRTINTSVTTVAALVGILVFGTAQIWNFAAAMTIGVVAATISSTFLASAFILWMEKFKAQRAAR